MREQITFLNVERPRREVFRFTLEPPYDPARAAGLRCWDVLVDPDIVDSFCDKLARAVEEAMAHPEVPGIGVEPFISRGRNLFDALLPCRRDKKVEELRDAISAVRTPLLITHDDPGICWELLNDGVGEGFLGLRVDLGRRLKSRNVPKQALRRAGEWRCLVVTDPNSDEPKWALPKAREEAEKLCAWLRASQLPAIEFLAGEQANFDSVVDRLASRAYDVIHYAGHVVYDASKNEYAMRLHAGKLLGADSISELVKGAPVVFLNSCWSARATGVSQIASSGLGMTDAFLGAGARAVIGSLYRAPDAGARAFAEAFYRAVLDGQTLGEAMRVARKAVMTAPGCGPAWACFVLYGDPCLKIEASAVEGALRTINLHSSQFDDASLNILEAARGYSGALDPISTAQFFAALIDGSAGLLADALRRQGAQPHKLRDLFRELFERQRQGRSWSPTPAESPRVSAGLRDMLWESASRARAVNKSKVAEEDLLFAFVRMRGGSLENFFREAGLDLAALLPAAAPDPAPPEPVTIGPLAEEDCEPEAWQVLLRAARGAIGAGVGFAGTPQLFRSLLAVPDSPLARGLSGYGMTFRAIQDSQSATALSGKISCSDNLKSVLLLAQANAAGGRRERVSARDLLDAFIAQGGGEAGRHLLEQGILLEVLVSDLFVEGGELDPGRFTEESNNILETARACAVQKGNDRIDRDHLLYGMLHHCLLLRRRLGGVGADPQLVIDRLYARIPGGLTTSSRAALRVTQMTPVLLKVLWLAASVAGEGKPIDSHHLLRAWIREGGGNGAELLLDCGLPLSGLAE